SNREPAAGLARGEENSGVGYERRRADNSVLRCILPWPVCPHKFAPIRLRGSAARRWKISAARRARARLTDYSGRSGRTP
ncbi:hypothetical protein, partial [Gluconobacter cerinus]|uniref:hypothetical protein n=1 Tax=Gluconobacter cerinus TaxID=38307 RepID=UPI001E2E0709